MAEVKLQLRGFGTSASNKDNIESQIESSDTTHNAMNGKVTIEKKPIKSPKLSVAFIKA